MVWLTVAVLLGATLLAAMLGRWLAGSRASKARALLATSAGIAIVTGIGTLLASTSVGPILGFILAVAIATPAVRALLDTPVGRSTAAWIVEVLILGLALTLAIEVSGRRNPATIARARQRSTVATLTRAGQALAAAAGAQSPPSVETSSPGDGALGTLDLRTFHRIDPGVLAPALVAAGAQPPPTRDGWGQLFELRIRPGSDDQPSSVVLRSPGADGRFEGAIYRPGPFPPTEFDRDIVWVDGRLVRWPAEE